MKAKIMKVGFIISNLPQGWHFNIEGRNIPALMIFTDGRPREYAGYTIEELTEISKEYYGIQFKDYDDGNLYIIGYNGEKLTIKMPSLN